MPTNNYAFVTVDSVIDGDTFRVLGFSRPAVCRLAGFDALEPGQARSQQCLDRITHLTLQRTFLGRIIEIDPYQRLAIELLNDEETALAIKLLREGLGWAVRQFSPQPQAYLNAQAFAKLHHRGIWQDPYPVPPWKWRKFVNPSGKKWFQAYHHRHKGA